MTTLHCHADKVGLILDVVGQWPKSRAWMTDHDGKRFESLRDAVQALVDVPTRYVPMGCPTPDDEGKCPGHPSDPTEAHEHLAGHARSARWPVRPWRALTIIQPWAWLIATGAKRVENRTFAPPAGWGGPLLIHAGKAPLMDLSPELRAIPWPQNMGVTGYTLGEQLDRMARRGEFVVGHVVAVVERVSAGPVRREESPFAFGPVCWWLDGIRALRDPVPCRGMQGLWTPAPDVVDQVEAQLSMRSEAT